MHGFRYTFFRLRRALFSSFSLIGHPQVYNLVLHCNCYCRPFLRFVLCSRARDRFLRLLAVEFTLVPVWGSHGLFCFAEFDSLCLVVGHCVCCSFVSLFRLHCSNSVRITLTAKCRVILIFSHIDSYQNPWPRKDLSGLLLITKNSFIELLKIDVGDFN
jgi:hypothetical protein